LRNGGRLWSLKLGWLSFALMALGRVVNMLGVFSGADVLYTAFPPLAESFAAAPLIYLGYLLVAAGALAITIDFLATVLTWVENWRSVRAWKKMLAEIHISTFAAICAVPLIFSIVLSAFFLYVPAVLWSLGWMSADAKEFALNFRLTYHVMFHIIHYIPAMAMIAAAYVLVELTTGAGSVYRKTVAKGLFSCTQRSCHNVISLMAVLRSMG
jgi:cytochrome c oxidase subunit 1